MPKNLMRAAKILVSAGLIAYLLYAVNWGRAASELHHANLSLVIVAAVIFIVNTVVTSAWKWQISLRIHGLSWRFLELSKILMIGLFLSNFLPTAIGGDIFRAYRTMPSGGQKSRAVSALLLDRVTGLLSMLLVGALGALVLYIRDSDADIGLLALILAGPPLIAATVPYVFGMPLFKPFFDKLAGVPKLEPLMNNARLIVADKSGLVGLVLVSMLFHFLAVIAITLLFVAAGTPHVLAESAVADTMYATAALLPISINGFGIQESSFAFTAHQLGISFNHAVIVALILRIISVATSLIGGIVFSFDKGRAADLAAQSKEADESPNEQRV